MMRLVFVHGFLGSALNWAPVLSRLKMPLAMMGVECVAYDLLWHSKRPGPLDKQSIKLETMAQDLMSQISKKDGERIFGLGHSFGIRPLLKIADMERDFFDGLIVEDSSPELSQKGFALLNQIFRDIPVPFSNREMAAIHLNQVFGEQSQMARFLLSNIGPDATGQQTWRFQATALQDLLEDSFHAPLWQEWEEFKNKMHLILGANSHFVSPEKVQKCLSLGKVYGRSFEEIPGAGHWVHSDQVESFCESVQKKIEEWA